MPTDVLGLREVDRTHSALVGGKGAALGELGRVEGVQVPDGFCVTTAAFTRMVEESGEVNHLRERLAQLAGSDRAQIGEAAAALRSTIEQAPVWPELRRAVAERLAGFAAGTAFAVRSSATAEDQPDASFAGQQESFLNVVGVDAVLSHIRRCWASLFTERAVVYRRQQGYDDRSVALAVVVQVMVQAEAAGVLFTADPLTGNRRVSTIEAVPGLGEALVGGQVNADSYRVRDGKVSGQGRADRPAAQARPGQRRRVLTRAQVLELARLGGQIEAHFGSPQDIEWCLAQGRFWVVQSRPITTLYPIPKADDAQNHVYVSVGHGQMMTDPMLPLGLAFFLMVTSAPMRIAGGRLFVDVSRNLASPAGTKVLIDVMGKNDPLLKDALRTVARRKGFIAPAPEGQPVPKAGYGNQPLTWAYLAPYEQRPELVPELMAKTQASLAELKEAMEGQSGVALFDLIQADIQRLRQVLFDPQSSALIQIAFYAAGWLNDRLRRWLGEVNAADTLALSVPHNVTAEMGLALLDVADAIRPYPAVAEYLEHATDAGFWAGLEAVPGGSEAGAALRGWLDAYGMRCAGEIDITRPRWAEAPTTLVPLLLSNLRNFEPGAAARKFEQGRLAAADKEREVLERLRRLPGGARKANETARMIALLRAYMGYREYPKYGMVSRTWVYKQALLREAARLVQAGVLETVEDSYYLSFAELRAAVDSGQADAALIRARRDDYRRYARLTPPRVITSDGEIIAGAYRRAGLPAGALPGLAVSAGRVEGRARVILRLEEADLAPGDILVTRFTDPSWTPLFVAAAGLVTEVGGLMTHGAVIAREYGLPAVVGVEDATRRIRDGQRIRVDGTAGYVEMVE